MNKTSSALSFFDHLDELRSRIIKSFFAFLIGSFIFYNFTDYWLIFLIKPIGKVFFISPSDAFAAKFSLTFLGGFFISLPIILYQIWKFIYSGLNQKEKNFVLIYAPLSFLFFILGVLFGYFIMIPISLQFFLSFSSDMMVPMITIDKYISFIMTFVVGFGVTFELPLILVFLARIGIASPAFLREKRRYAIVLILIVSAILTPPDVMSQLLMAAPLLLLYEISIFACALTYRSR